MSVSPKCPYVGFFYEPQQKEGFFLTLSVLSCSPDVTSSKSSLAIRSLKSRGGWEVKGHACNDNTHQTGIFRRQKALTEVSKQNKTKLNQRKMQRRRKRTESKQAGR